MLSCMKSNRRNRKYNNDDTAARTRTITRFVMTILILLISIVTTTTTSTTTTLFVSALSSPPNQGSSKIQRFELHPTGALIEERRRRKRRRRLNEERRRQQQDENNDDIAAIMNLILISNDDDIPSEWFHPFVRGVYATIQPPTSISQFDDDDDDDDEDIYTRQQYDDFMKYRHLSRYERQLRQSLNLDLYPYWNGNYSNISTTAKILSSVFEDNDVEESSPIKNTNETTTTIMSLRRRQQQQQRRRQLILQSLKGGKFDNYQGIPLSQGYGTHYCHLWVGSPTPQRQTVIVDTGSHFTGFPVKGCNNCGERHHTDPHFDPTKSTSFRPLLCPTECLENYICDNTPIILEEGDFQQHEQQQSQSPRCKFKQAYTEGSSWTAYQAKDIVYCGGTDLMEAVDPTDIEYSIPFVFGCLQENTGLFVTQLADGIMGMSAHELTLTKQMYNAGKLEYNMFAMCFRKELGTSKRGVTAGSMTLGGVSSTLDTSPMVFARNIQPYGWFTVYIEAVYVARNGGDKFLFDTPESTKGIIEIPIDHSKINVGRGVIVDSGTTDTYINSNVRPAFAKIWKEVTGMEYSHGPVYLTQAQLKRLPTLLIQMQATNEGPIMGSSSLTSAIQPVLGQTGYLDTDRWTDLLLAIPATNYMEYSPTLKVYTSRLFFTETRGGVLGANAMQGHNVLFDWQHGRIGFAQSSCAYDLIAGENDQRGAFGTSSSESVGTDCILDVDRPILTQSCMETVDVTICEASDHPTNVDISGMEIWTLVVDAPGDPGSCEIAMKEWIESQDTIRQIDPSISNCTMDGLCQEFRPCHVRCMDALEYHKQKRENGGQVKEAVTIPHPVIDEKYLNDSALEDECNDSIWSACDYSCRQSRISSSPVLHDNGQYCVELSRETRSCHIDACGRSDPCIVPFLVHAIFVLEGPTDEWTNVQEDIFRKELTAAANQPDRHLFEEGDINILIARPWYGSDDDDVKDEGEDVEQVDENTQSDPLGMQVILQISISNPKALKSISNNNQHQHGRQLLQEVGVIWSNLTQVFRSPTSTSMCDPYDLYPLAKDAHEIANNILTHRIFTASLGQNMKPYDKVRLVSSWTIGTQVYDDYINYLGPLASTPFFMLVKFLHEAFILMTIAWFGMCLLKVFRISRVCLFRGFKHWQPHYEAVLTKDDDDNDIKNEEEAKLMNSTFRNGVGNSTSNSSRIVAQHHQPKEVELTVTYNMRSTATIKRRNSTTEY